MENYIINIENKATYMKKTVVSLILIIFCQQILASSFDNNKFDFNQPHENLKVNTSELYIYGNEKNTKQLEHSLINGININKPLIELFLNNLAVKGWLYQQSSQSSFSNAQTTNCEINMSYQKNLQPVLLNDINKDVLFVLTHEISHCILGKQIFTQGIDWKFKLSSETQQKIDLLIKKRTNEAIDNLNAKIEDNKTIPMIVYHEMFADTMATMWLFSQNKINREDIKNIIRERKNDYQFANKETAYVSFLSLDNLLKLLDNNPQLLEHKSLKEIKEMAILLSQKSFITYLIK